ncbi:hypothetical protein CMK18_22680 [Candidatus Poribacteria bacterium]|nr:hypothetical protein [Candidatus Poribacteria bacterium]|tara:strand:+ start:734 stop:1021 length:288 start_codon:yes stop_codon:yes gene_type:complete
MSNSSSAHCKRVGLVLSEKQNKFLSKEAKKSEDGNVSAYLRRLIDQAEINAKGAVSSKSKKPVKPVKAVKAVKAVKNTKSPRKKVAAKKRLKKRS